MNKKLTGLALFLLCSMLSVPSAFAIGTCGNAKMNVYDASGFSCTLDNGNLLFSNFTYSDGPVLDSSVNVIPVSDANGFGFNFNGGWQVLGANQNEDVLITFDVTGLNGTQVEDLYIDFGNVTTSNGGNVLYTEQFCKGLPTNCTTFIDAPTTNSETDVTFAPVSSLTISKDLTLSTGTNPAGIAATSLFGNQYSTVPEPRAISLLLGLILFAAVAIMKRRQVTQS